MKKYFMKQVVLTVFALCLMLTGCSLGGSVVTYYNNGEVYETVEVDKGAVLEEPSTPDAAGAGYSFVGWSTVDGSSDALYDFVVSEVTEDISLYAVWEKTRAIVTVDPGNGEEVYTVKVAMNKKLNDAALNTPKLAGKKFSGWFTESGELYNFDTVVSGDFKLVGKFEDDPDSMVVDPKWDFTVGVGKWIGASDRGEGRNLPTTEDEDGVTITYPENGWKGLLLEDMVIPVIENGLLKVVYKTELPVDDYRVYIQTEKGGSLTIKDLEDAKSYYATVAVANANLGAWSEAVGEDGWTTVTFDLDSLEYYKDGTVMSGITFVLVASGEGSVSYKSVTIE